MGQTAFIALVVVGPLLGAWLLSRPATARKLLRVVAAAVLLLTLFPTTYRTVDTRCLVDGGLAHLAAPEPLANVVLFVPLILLAGIRTRRPLAMFLAGTVLSALIEAVQAFVPVLGRSCTTGDWLANSAGALTGAVLAAAAIWIHRARSKRRLPEESSL
ncbi:VanZ family protein [Arthrobacter sp. BL-252-APC-1A]|uniref:VanZ family protein n=1 Tax=Arthrobacter sp. BL-252-APC-1A TaxID=2606622 RepID=UPI0012B3E7F8|nr:VanZ family protein [Arthrobacter sp. BL-252-APC-1A]MSR98939.1 VanZ family protein [Arthrobacter sp. BL-252-APC-1A]